VFYSLKEAGGDIPEEGVAASVDPDGADKKAATFRTDAGFKYIRPTDQRINLLTVS
jgi:hypothetical protein